MLERGFPPTTRGRLGGNVLHWAAYLGNDEIIEHALKTQPFLNDRDTSFDALPTGWAIVGYEDTNAPVRNHSRCLELLLDAGAECSDEWYPTGHENIDAVLRKHFYPVT